MTNWNNRGYVYGVIRKLRTEVEAFEGQTERVEKDLAAALLDSRRRQLELSTLVIALVETLAASGALDLDVLDGRVENMRAERPWSSENPEPLTAEHPYQCAGCFRAMAISEGTLVAGGMRCPRCMAGRG